MMSAAQDLVITTTNIQTVNTVNTLSPVYDSLSIRSIGPYSDRIQSQTWSTECTLSEKTGSLNLYFRIDSRAPLETSHVPRLPICCDAGKALSPTVWLEALPWREQRRQRTASGKSFKPKQFWFWAALICARRASSPPVHRIALLKIKIVFVSVLVGFQSCPTSI